MQGSLLIDISRLVVRTARGRLPTGVDRVCLAYVAQFGSRAQAVIQKGGWRRIIPFRESQELFALLQNPQSRFVLKAAQVIAKACLPPWPSQDAKGRIYFNPGHSGLDDRGMPGWLRRTRQRPVFMVHDLIPLTNPEFCRPGERQRHIARLSTVLEAGAGVLTNSKVTLEQLQQFADASALPLPPVAVAPLAPAALSLSPDATPPMGEPYFVILGTIEPRKNHLLLLNLWRQFVSEMGDRAPHLVVIGQRGWECDEILNMLERCAAGPRAKVHELPACPDAELARYLCHARALLFPSFAEGYGIPLVEALMLGTPVIASDLPVFHEIAGDIPDYLDPHDSHGWARAIREYAQPGSAQRNAQLERLAGFETPTWADHFKCVEALLERLQ
jgi:glycosyltransferase involved in cell wall biosynthesis